MNIIRLVLIIYLVTLLNTGEIAFINNNVPNPFPTSDIQLDLVYVSSQAQDNTYTEIVLDIIERIIKNVENIFWDEIDGGYFKAIKYRSLTRLKPLETITNAIEAYSLLYNKTKNATYLNKINYLVDLTFNFKFEDMYLFFIEMSKNFSYPYVKDGASEINGYASILSSIKLAISLLSAYNIIKNITFLNIAKNISNAIYMNFWDNVKGGIFSIDKDYRIIKKLDVQIFYFILNIYLYEITHRETFLNYSKELLSVLDSMWNTGLSDVYTINLNPVYTGYRNILYQITLPAYAYLLSYKYFRNITYLNRAYELIYTNLFYGWDPIYGGYYHTLDTLGNPLNTTKYSHNLLYEIIILSRILQIINDTNMRSLIIHRLSGLLKLVCLKFNTTEGIIASASRENFAIDYTIYSSYQFEFITALLMYNKILQIDKTPPIVIFATLKNNNLYLKAIDLEQTISKVEFVTENDTITFTILPEGQFSIKNPPSSGIIIVTDSSGNYIELYAQINNNKSRNSITLSSTFLIAFLNILVPVIVAIILLKLFFEKNEI